MPENTQSPESPAEWTRRGACALLALGLAKSTPAAAAEIAVAQPVSNGPAQATAEIAAALAERFALKRQAYQTGNAQLLRSFYDEDIVIVGERMMKPLLGIERVIAAYEALLPKRRDIEVSVLRFEHSPDGESAYQFVRFVAYPKDPAESPPVATFLFLWRRRPTGWRCGVESLLLQDLSLTPGFARSNK